MSMLDRRLNVITGKGGVGKSTVTAALALVAQQRGKRVLCCEVTAKERVSGLLGASDSGPEVRQIDRSIWSVHVQPEVAMREYGTMVLRFKALYSAVFENRLVRYFTKALPALPEIVMLGKIWWHVTQDRDESGRYRWDLVLLDAPATGHGISLLRTPQSILEMVDEGPMVRDMKAMQAMLVDPKTTAIHIVALPEEMPTNEAIELHQALAGLPDGKLVLNGWSEPRFNDDERTTVRRSDDGELASAREAIRMYGQQQDLSAQYEARLREGVDLGLLRLPLLAGPRFGRPEVESLAAIAAPEI
jgi:anion-transporting  ArsA/GET3 family ATPase